MTDPPRRILIVGEEAAVRLGVSQFLGAHGFEADEADTRAAAEEALRTSAPDAVVLDHRLLDGDALDLLGRIKSIEPQLPVVFLTGRSPVDLAARAIQSGADQLLAKPFDLPALRVIVERLLENRRARRRQLAASLQPGLPHRDPFAGASTAIRRLEDEARGALESGNTILIEGEAGTGKGVLAAWLHRNGPRRDEPFVTVHSAGLSRERLEAELFGYEKGSFAGAVTGRPGVLEVAHHGTAFVDEVGDLDRALQARFLLLVEEKRFRRMGAKDDRHADIHLIASTQRDLLALARTQAFREDLYYRMAGIALRIPPLRERLEDVRFLAAAILEELQVELGRGRATLTPDAAAALSSHGWPGNVRELRNALERAMIRAGHGGIERRHLALDPPPASSALAPDLDLTLGELERRHIQRLLEAEGGHVERAAKRLGIPRSSLYQKLKQMGLSPRR